VKLLSLDSYLAADGYWCNRDFSPTIKKEERCQVGVFVSIQSVDLEKRDFVALQVEQIEFVAGEIPKTIFAP
jgi:hypothetical protein